ncbi:hypothetical protein ARMGADRAFT_56467 [Armillaria gallica]|uniref:Uncharacterized protein n=1 Tax=Armillaria gallica TaxID=47427 RepID=A0A2H3EAR2_ARMGA|nr:hypothetical protein ARMGADRAFT_56467 [Armillaria gallica]
MALLSCYHLLTTKLQLIRYTTVPPSQKKMEQDLDTTLWLGVEPSFSRKIRIRLIYYRDCLSRQSPSQSSLLFIAMGMFHRQNSLSSLSDVPSTAKETRASNSRCQPFHALRG